MMQIDPSIHYGDIANLNKKSRNLSLQICFRNISITTWPICAKFWIQDPIFARIIFEEMIQIDPSIHYGDIAKTNLEFT